MAILRVSLLVASFAAFISVPLPTSAYTGGYKIKMNVGTWKWTITGRTFVPGREATLTIPLPHDCRLTYTPGLESEWHCVASKKCGGGIAVKGGVSLDHYWAIQKRPKTAMLTICAGENVDKSKMPKQPVNFFQSKGKGKKAVQITTALNVVEQVGDDGAERYAVFKVRVRGAKKKMTVPVDAMGVSHPFMKVEVGRVPGVGSLETSVSIEDKQAELLKTIPVYRVENMNANQFFLTRTHKEFNKLSDGFAIIAPAVVTDSPTVVTVEAREPFPENAIALVLGKGGMRFTAESKKGVAKYVFTDENKGQALVFDRPEIDAKVLNFGPK